MYSLKGLNTEFMYGAWMSSLQLLVALCLITSFASSASYIINYTVLGECVFVCLCVRVCVCVCVCVCLCVCLCMCLCCLRADISN